MPEQPQQTVQMGKRKLYRYVGIGIVSVLFVALAAPGLSRIIANLTMSTSEKVKQRDEQRLRDIKLIYAAIMQYRIKKGVYPPSITEYPFINDSSSDEDIWIHDLDAYYLPFDAASGQTLVKLPRDPLNTGKYIY
ncbi:MAG TPA: hypothetical protein PKL83_07480, partial [bacterium]|nr:hypothetical protein [bacterium]